MTANEMSGEVRVRKVIQRSQTKWMLIVWLVMEDEKPLVRPVRRMLHLCKRWGIRHGF